MRTARPEVDCGSLERGALALARGTFLALALQVEHRVVDADREPDQQHDRADVLVDRPDLARDREQAHRRHHRREGEQQRDPRGHERPEGDHEDDDRDREREQPCPLEVLVELLVDLLLGADAELVDRQGRVSSGRRVDGVDHRVDLVDGLVGVAADVEVDDRRVAVRGDLSAIGRGVRALHVRDDRDGGHAADDLLDGGPEGRVVGGERPALDEHRLVGGLIERLVEDPGGPAGLAGEGLVVAELLGADRPADHDGGDDEREPAEDRGLPMARAPAAHPGRDVGAGLQGGHCLVTPVPRLRSQARTPRAPCR